MAASKARRMRDKMVREGKMDPSLKRGSWHGVNPVERKPERPEIEKRRKEQKHRGRLIRGNELDVSFLFLSRILATEQLPSNDEQQQSEKIIGYVEEELIWSRLHMVNL